MFRHYIWCRYNTSLYSGNKHHIIDPEVWMVARLPLFERLLRSLATQTNIDYCLLVALDPLTPIQHRDLIEASLYKSGVPARIVVSSGRRVGYRSLCKTGLGIASQKPNTSSPRALTTTTSIFPPSSKPSKTSSHQELRFLTCRRSVRRACLLHVGTSCA